MFKKNWHKKLSAYNKTDEYKTNLKLLKKDLKKSFPDEKPDEQAVFLFTGVTGSGKSTLAKIIRNNYPAILVATDWIFFQELKLDNYYKAYIYRRGLLKWSLKLGYSVVLDSNFRTVSNRMRIYKLAKEFNASAILIKLDVEVDTAAKRRTMKGGEKVSFEKKKLGVINSLADIEPISDEEIKYAKVVKLDANKSLSKLVKEIFDHF